jgi:hypothetical protein
MLVNRKKIIVRISNLFSKFFEKIRTKINYENLENEEMVKSSKRCQRLYSTTKALSKKLQLKSFFNAKSDIMGQLCIAEKIY